MATDSDVRKKNGGLAPDRDGDGETSDLDHHAIPEQRLVQLTLHVEIPSVEKNVVDRRLSDSMISIELLMNLKEMFGAVSSEDLDVDRLSEVDNIAQRLQGEIAS